MGVGLGDNSMNIFATSHNPVLAATEHCLVHLRKMPTELAQMLSTTHRVCDGQVIKVKKKYPNRPDKLVDFLALPSDTFNHDGSLKKTVLYKATHENHPCTVWIRHCKENYRWAYNHYVALCTAFYQATGRIHKASSLKDALLCTPHNLKVSRGCHTPFAMAMPDEYKSSDPVKSYHRFLNEHKWRDWRERDVPIPIYFPFGSPNWYDGPREGRAVPLISELYHERGK